MTTQSLRGMANHGPDALARRPHRRQRPGRRRARRGRGVQEVQRRVRRPARPRRRRSRDADMQAFTDFILQVTYPPNPIRASTTRSRRRSRPAATFFFGPHHRRRLQTCNGCHALDPAHGLLRHRRRRRASRTRRSMFKIAAPAQRVPEGRHVRHAADRRSSTPATTASRATRSAASASCTTAASTRVFRFLSATVFNQSRVNPAASRRRPATAAPAGRAVHARLRHQPGADRRPADHAHRAPTARPSGARIDLLIARAAAGECDLVVKGTSRGEQRGWLRRRRRHVPDRPRQRGAAHRRRSCARSPPPPGRSSPTPACRRARARASASTATRTASSTATSSTPAAIRPIRRASPGGADDDEHHHDQPVGTTTTSTTLPARSR